MDRKVSILSRLPRISLVVVAGVALLAAACASGPSPSAGDDWHASYAVWVCGQPVASFPESAHTLGDGLIHSKAGGGLSLTEFFDSVGAELNEDSLRLPGEDLPRRDHSICHDGRPAKLIVVVNHDTLSDDELKGYEPQDGDRIMVAFLPSGSIRPSVPTPPQPAPH
jgi:hypothetical protein